VQKNLTVCLNPQQEKGNCGCYAKCTRTMTELETADALDSFSDVFDVKTFRMNPGYHWGYVIL